MSNEEFVYQGVLEGELEIDEQGRIWRLKERKRNLAGEICLRDCERRRAEQGWHSDRYLNVTRQVNGQRVKALAHRVVWLHIHGAPAGLSQINHKNGVRFENAPANLELSDPSAQMVHCRDVLKKMFWLRGEENGASKLGLAQITEIRELCRQGVSQRTVATSFAISQGHVSNIHRGRFWRNVTAQPSPA